MRTIHLCRACATAYLPPETMRYDGLGLVASPVRCSRCQALGRGRIDATGLPGEVFRQLAARLDREQRRGERPPRLLVRSTGPRRRVRTGPAAARWRLG